MTPTTLEVTQGGNNGRTVADLLRRGLRRLAICTAVLYVALIIGGILVYLSNQNTLAALCSVRQDMEQRVLATTDFLKDNPEGFPGVDTKTILANLANQQRTINALKSLNCDYTLIPPPSTPSVPQGGNP